MLHACRSQKIELAVCQGGLPKSQSADTSHLAPPPSLHSKGGHAPTRNLLTQGSDVAWAVAPERHDSASSSMEFRQGPAMPGSSRLPVLGKMGTAGSMPVFLQHKSPTAPSSPVRTAPAHLPTCPSHPPLFASAHASPRSRPRQCAHIACSLMVWAARHLKLMLWRSCLRCRLETSELKSSPPEPVDVCTGVSEAAELRGAASIPGVEGRGG